MSIQVTKSSSKIILQLSLTKVTFRYQHSSRSPMAYNITDTLDKLTCTDYVDFGKCQDIFGQFSWTKIDSNYLDVKLKVFKREDKISNFD